MTAPDTEQLIDAMELASLDEVKMTYEQFLEDCNLLTDNFILCFPEERFESHDRDGFVFYTTLDKFLDNLTLSSFTKVNPENVRCTEDYRASIFEYIVMNMPNCQEFSDIFYDDECSEPDDLDYSGIYVCEWIGCDKPICNPYTCWCSEHLNDH